MNRLRFQERLSAETRRFIGHHPPACRGGGRAGFTLIEVLLVTILSAVLMVGLWSLFGTYIRLFESGPKRTERSQLLRAMKQQLTDDLHAVIQIPQIPESGAGTTMFGNVASSAGTPSFSAAAAAPSRSTLPRFGLIGTRQSLTLYVLQAVSASEQSLSASKEMMPVAGGFPGMKKNPISLVPELRSILYTFSEPRVMKIGDRDAPPGLIRRELDWQTTAANREISTANDDAFDAPNLMGIPAEELAADNSIAWIPEVIDIKFRYLGGGQWFDEWDSHQRKALPSAVEVVMIFGVQPEEEPDLSELESMTKSPDGDNPKTGSDFESDVDLESESDSLLVSENRKPRYRFLVQLPNAISNGGNGGLHAGSSGAGPLPGAAP